MSNLFSIPTVKNCKLLYALHHSFYDPVKFSTWAVCLMDQIKNTLSSFKPVRQNITKSVHIFAYKVKLCKPPDS